MKANAFSLLMDTDGDGDEDKILQNVAAELEKQKIDVSEEETTPKKRGTKGKGKKESPSPAKKKHSDKRENNKKKQDGPQQQNLEKAVKAFNCKKTQVQSFNQKDPLNPSNTLTGYVCKKEGSMIGSLYVTHCNGSELAEPQLIYGAPKMWVPYQRASGSAVGGDEEDREDEQVSAPTQRIFIDFPDCEQYCLLNKWNGANIVFYKYKDEKGATFLSAKPRQLAFVNDSSLGNYLSALKEFLKMEQGPLTLDEKRLPASLAPLLGEKVQSLTFELCGNKFPHLVKYDFEVALEPLFQTFHDGVIQPIHNAKGPRFNVPLLLPTSKFDKIQLVKILSDYQKEALAANEKHRKDHNLKKCYWYDHFAVEGLVLYPLDKDGNLINRDAMYKIKPQDIELFHWEQFDVNFQLRVLEALHKLFEREKEVNEENMKSELDIGEGPWQRFSKDIMDMVEGIPHPKFRNSGMNPQVLVLVGIPGSGKSTLAEQLAKDGWVRVNQDELGNRRACESRVEDALKKMKSVVIDRCNYDVWQRHHWFKIAGKYGVHNLNAAVLEIDPELCKQRVFVRKDHPTIKEAAQDGARIIDNFVHMMVLPSTVEGFGSITILKTPEEVNGFPAKLRLDGQKEER